MKNDKKLNIGLFIDTFFPMIDGVVNVVDNYAKRLVKYANVTVFTIAPRDKNYVDNFPYKVVRCQKMDIPGLDYDLAMPKFDAKFNEELKNAKLDIVHIHSPFAIGKAGVNYAKKHHIPAVATNHSQFKQDFFNATKSPAITEILLATIMKTFNRCDENWSVNPKTAELFYDYGLRKMPKLMKNGTDFDCNETEKYDVDIKSKYAIGENDKVLIYVGRIVDLKNIQFLIDAFDIISKKDSSFKLVLAGDGLRLEYYKKMAKTMGLEDKIIFTGKISDRVLLGSLYKNADLLVFPSYYDTDGLTKKEAAAFKTPTLVLENSFAGSDIVDNVNGYVAKNSVQDFANKVFDIFENKQVYDSVCQNCLDQIYANWDSIVDLAFEEYKKLIQAKKIEIIGKKMFKNYPKTTKAVRNFKKTVKDNKRKHENKVKTFASKHAKTIKSINIKTKKANAK